MQGIEKRLEALGEKLGCKFESNCWANRVIYIDVLNADNLIVDEYTLGRLMYDILVYTNYVASFEDASDVEPKSFTDFIYSKEYNTDFEILTNHIIDTLVKDEE